MISRRWHGIVRTEKADEYQAYLVETGVTDYQATAGNHGVYILRRDDDGDTHFEVLTLWDSVESIQAFAGEDISCARYYPLDREYLVELEPRVEHHEVVVAVGVV
jgi:heme-degrading monooxygenase HmoA